MVVIVVLLSYSKLSCVGLQCSSPCTTPDFVSRIVCLILKKLYLLFIVNDQVVSHNTPPTLISLDSSVVPESTPAGSVIGTLSTIDDTDYQFSYDLVNQTVSGEK